ncbi:MBL fold metallo-hydrolase [Clostridium sp. SHJSY1]|uniref:ComEC/Rec2 family competence protein n=1 Tax=Clostridium sp. SHJSY1 TaxID=2942483 RepID=UPI0028769986|nr:ComEC/Rec2 family competence protein [Clostridium sp. SHJSY1]MDS0527561.1 MBL fold metallo-hydrolase [Clostridium sp. SHJSY1]
MKKLLSKSFLSILTVFTILCLTLFTNAKASDIKNYKLESTSITLNTKTSEDILKIHFIDVGQGDSILLQQGSHNMLIDAGPGESKNSLSSYLSNQGITNFDYVVGTHPHEDHIGNLAYIINSFKIGNVYFPNITSTTKTFSNFVTALKNKGLKLTSPKVGSTFMLGQAKCTILAPNSNSYDNANNYSIVIRVEYKNNSFLFTGDAQAVSESEILKNGLTLKSDVLKIGHHGSNTSTSTNFLNAVNPKYAVISVGLNNSYGHPADSTINKLTNKGIQVYRTDENGTIIMESNGSNISISSTK